MNRTRTPKFESEEEGFIALAFPSPFHFGGSEDVKRDLHQIDDPTTFLLKWYDACVIAHLNLEAGSRIHVHISPRSSCYEFSASNRDLPINVDVLHATCTSWRLGRKRQYLRTPQCWVGGLRAQEKRGWLMSRAYHALVCLPLTKAQSDKENIHIKRVSPLNYVIFMA